MGKPSKPKVRVTFLELSPESESDEDDEDEDRLIQIFVIGCRKSGKSTFISRVLHNEFTLSYTPTRTIEIHTPTRVGNLLYEMWEVPPDIPLAKDIAPDAVLLLFDPNENSMNDITQIWETFVNNLHLVHPPHLWVVVQDMNTLSAIPNVAFCAQERIFKVNNCSLDGMLELIGDIVNTFTKSY
jgi:hypothetical protein